MRKACLLGLLATTVFVVLGCAKDTSSEVVPGGKPPVAITKDAKTKGGPQGATLD